MSRAIRHPRHPWRAPSARWRRTVGGPIVAVLALSLGACTVIELRAGPDDVRIERSFGFASIDVHPQRDAVVARTWILGLGQSPFGFSAGYADHEIAALPPSTCRVVLWVDDAAQVEAFRTLLADVHDVCLLTPSDPAAADAAATTPTP